MHLQRAALLATTLPSTLISAAPFLFTSLFHHQAKRDAVQQPITSIQLGPRPYYLVNDMDPSPLKDELSSCSEMAPMRTSKFSISHRGAPLQFPEHSLQGLLAGAHMGAGIMECDVAFTSDRQLVCRHSQCDLHTTTDILIHPELAAKCNTTFTPATDDEDASALCCTSDITLAEFKSLCGKMDASNASATTPEDYLGGTAPWRTELYDQCGTLLEHKEYISIVDSLGLDFTPELKTPVVAMPYEGFYTQQMYAQQMIDDYKTSGIDPSRVWPQSFLPDDIFYWLDAEPEFGKQAIYLDERIDTPSGYADAVASLPDLAKRGVRIVSPPIVALLNVSSSGEIVPSPYAVAAKDAGLDMITWSLERSGPLKMAAQEEEYYVQSVADAVSHDGDLYNIVDALTRKVGIKGLFADWPATVTYYANCMGL